jgi:ribosomal protein S12 methylthiotransferase
MKFDRMGAFTYSHEENTHAHKADDNVPEEVKKERAGMLMEVQRKISHKLNTQKVGEKLKVLIDRKEGDYFIGRTEHDSPEVDNEVLVKADNNTYLRVGDFATIEIISGEDYDLYGKPVMSYKL